MSTLKINVRPAALDELERAWSWYEDRRPGLGEEFRACVDAALGAAARDPLAYPRIHGELRRVLVRRFPYVVLYLAEADRLEVIAVFHGARDPREWRRRTGGG
ncbi:type II toxin-antitoxin system RelE/ParE family toxin [Myxococcota bacterium]|nr:type II toxin-antitoxin system RelE/ParE family toxin [Myxococcota bacterium]